jgi:hypothetical protein
MIVGEDADRGAAHTIPLAVPRARDRATERLRPPPPVAGQLSISGRIGLDPALAVAARVLTVGVIPRTTLASAPGKGVSIRGERTFEEVQAVDPRLSQAIQHMMGLPADQITGGAGAAWRKSCRC